MTAGNWAAATRLIAGLVSKQMGKAIVVSIN